MNKVAFNARLSEVQGELHHSTPPETCVTSLDVEVAYHNGKSFLIPGRVYFHAGLAKGFCLGIITFLAIGGIVFLRGGGWPAFIFSGFGLAIGAAFAVEAVRQQADLVLVMPNGIFHKGWNGVKRHYWGACWGDIVGFEIGINNNSEGSPSRMYFQVHDNIETRYSAIIARHHGHLHILEIKHWKVKWEKHHHQGPRKPPQETFNSTKIQPHYENAMTSSLRNFGLDWDSLRPAIYFKSSEKMAEVGDASVDLVVTSPPYGSIKDYGIDGQIGFADSFEDYFARLKRVWSECWRVLKPGSRLVVNVGDQYLRKIEHERYRIVPIGAQIILDCLGLGFDFLGDVIWQKVSTTNTTGGCSLMGSLFYPNNGLFTFDYEHVLIFKKVGASASKIAQDLREYSKIPLDEWKRWFTGHWRFPGIVQKEHIAMFPEELPHRIIRMFSAVGDTILDPFAGSGTTLKVAQSLLRRSIGYEINPQFETVIQQKISEAHPDLFPDYQLLLNAILSSDRYALDIGFSRQKGVTCFQDRVSNNRLVVDYLVNDAAEDAGEQQLLEKKLEENPFQSYQKGLKDWASVDRYIVVVNPGFATPVKAPSCPRPYGVVVFKDVTTPAGETDYLGKIFSQLGNHAPPTGKSSLTPQKSLSEFFRKS